MKPKEAASIVDALKKTKKHPLDTRAIVEEVVDGKRYDQSSENPEDHRPEDVEPGSTILITFSRRAGLLEGLGTEYLNRSENLGKNTKTVEQVLDSLGFLAIDPETDPQVGPDAADTPQLALYGNSSPGYNPRTDHVKAVLHFHDQNPR